MLHDPKAFAHLCRRMRRPQPARDAEPMPAIAELIDRVEAVLTTRTPPTP